ncbi:hypothetical protein ACFQ7F_43795, partial [Streptomyces sp. NPDC056486]|uniref:hypothetical protein n=1 Tax=Streptomyces sp. NPDC056486 TaxID=3345835 RepID=UPI0036C57CC3
AVGAAFVRAGHQAGAGPPDLPGTPPGPLRPQVLHGPIVITGAYSDNVELGPLPDEFAAQVRTAAAAICETMQSWQERSPDSADSAIAQILASLQSDMTSA